MTLSRRQLLIGAAGAVAGLALSPRGIVAGAMIGEAEVASNLLSRACLDYAGRGSPMMIDNGDIYLSGTFLPCRYGSCDTCSGYDQCGGEWAGSTVEDRIS